jgi:hypothetical protein
MSTEPVQSADYQSLNNLIIPQPTTGEARFDFFGAVMSKALFMQQNLQPGEIYAGIVLGQNGTGDHHLFLLPAKTEPLTWDKAVSWAESVGGSLPTRQEQAILYGNLKHEFEPRWYWSSTQHADGSDCAWMQTFSNGYQDDTRKSCECRARAVRRLLIIE